MTGGLLDRGEKQGDKRHEPLKFNLLSSKEKKVLTKIKCPFKEQTMNKP